MLGGIFLKLAFKHFGNWATAITFALQNFYKQISEKNSIINAYYSTISEKRP